MMSELFFGVLLCSITLLYFTLVMQLWSGYIRLSLLSSLVRSSSWYAQLHTLVVVKSRRVRVLGLETYLSPKRTCTVHLFCRLGY